MNNWVLLSKRGMLFRIQTSTSGTVKVSQFLEHVYLPCQFTDPYLHSSDTFNNIHYINDEMPDYY